MEKGPPGQSCLDKGGGDRQDAFLLGKGFSCCCGLFSGKSFGSWMLHGSTFVPQSDFSGCFSRLTLSKDCGLDLSGLDFIGWGLHLQREGSALEEHWKSFSRLLLWSWLPEKADIRCISVVMWPKHSTVLEWAFYGIKLIFRLGRLEFCAFYE